MLQKINAISNKQDNSVELDESSAEFKLMSEKNRQLEIIENELQKVTTALNASQINESFDLFLILIIFLKALPLYSIGAKFIYI